MNKNTVLINAQYAETTAREALRHGKTIKDVLIAGMRGTRAGNWLERNDTYLLMAALTGVMQAYGIHSPESVRIVESARRMTQYEQYLQALQQGVKAEPPENTPQDHLPLINLWVASAEPA